MAENYTIRSFGFNVIPRTNKEQEHVEKKVEKAIEGLWTPVFDYLEENKSVFNGDINKAIERANIQMLNIGMEMRQADTKHSFDTKI